MSKTKRHPCGNCIAFGDEVCMQNYLECDYAEIEEEKKMENKFKVGDKVVYAGKTDIVDGYTIINKCVYFVSGIASGIHIRLDGFGDSEFHVSHFELYKEPKFHSSHYESDSIEPIEFMMSNKLDFCRASIIKYAFRAGKKEGQESLDIKKIIDYAILLAMQEGIDFTYQDAKDIIDYRFEWEGKRK